MKNQTPKEFAEELLLYHSIEDCTLVRTHCSITLDQLIQQAMEVEVEFSCGYADNAIRFYTEAKKKLFKL